MFRIQQ